MLYLNDELVEVTKFPDNTSQVWKLHGFPLTAHVRWEFSNESEFMQLAQLKDLLDEHGVQSFLELPYLPYGRQDKRISNDTTFALHTFAKLLNGLKFQRVMVTDPHSVTAEALIYKMVPCYPIERVKTVYEEVKAHIVCYPDSGATIKYISIYNLPHISGDKVRDPLTGQITDYKIDGKDVLGANVLIVDDICDGGATFILLTNTTRAIRLASR